MEVRIEILKRAHMPPSILEALEITLPKKGDSANALDYHSISLLQTSYNFFCEGSGHALTAAPANVD